MLFARGPELDQTWLPAVAFVAGTRRAEERRHARTRGFGPRWRKPREPLLGCLTTTNGAPSGRSTGSRWEASQEIRSQHLRIPPAAEPDQLAPWNLAPRTRLPGHADSRPGHAAHLQAVLGWGRRRRRRQGIAQLDPHTLPRVSVARERVGRNLLIARCRGRDHVE